LKTPVSTPVHLPLSTRLDEISLRPAAHIGVGFQRIVFSDATAAIFVKKQVMGTRSTKRHNTKGRNGKDKISLWRELIDMIEDKGLAVRAALDLLAASEILSSAALNHRKKWISIEFGLASRKTSCLRLLLCSRFALVS
jgi:hypothetical protein